MANDPVKMSGFRVITAEELGGDDLVPLVLLPPEDDAEGANENVAMPFDEFRNVLVEEVSWNDLNDKPDLATVATSGSYEDLTDKPTLGTAAAAATTDFAASNHTQAISTVTGLQAELDAKLAATAVGAAGGAASLDGDGLIPAGQLPAIAVTDVFEVASEAAMLALDAETGDLAIRTDENKCYILSTNSPSTLADWKLLRTPTDLVQAVAGLTGTITAAALRAALSLATIATSGDYADLSGKPTLGTAAALDVGTTANKVVQLDVSAKLPALDGTQLTGPAQLAQTALAYASPTTTIDMSAGQMRLITLTGDVTFATSNRAAPRAVTLIITCDGSPRTFTFPAWRFVGDGGAPTGIAAGKIAVLTLTCTNGNDSGIVAAYAEEP